MEYQTSKFITSRPAESCNKNIRIISESIHSIINNYNTNENKYFKQDV
jgi:hypothetical protein